MKEDETQEVRYVLVPKRGWLVIESQVPDHSFDPPLWVRGEEIGCFRTREEARLFMVAFTQPPVSKGGSE